MELPTSPSPPASPPTPTGAAAGPGAWSTRRARTSTRCCTRPTNLYLHENALNPFRFPSPGASGSMTSGGTESVMQAVRVARDRARAERGVERPTPVVPRTAHPAFAKGAKYVLRYQAFLYDDWPGGLYGRMDEAGWHLDRQSGPEALHMTVSPEHHRVVDQFLGDLAAAMADPGTARGAEIRYS
ncbi:hypothetical protein ACOBQX_16595 [Actinokineospora sp. G85]|uniref:hypothetical protein n=1 Tax=Actinokineospora sp. G85 TaxID=3406626 RepID=UPI003C770222